MISQICTVCNKKQEINNFPKDSQKKSGYQKRCKECKRREEVERRIKYNLLIPLIKCNKCGIEKRITEFVKDSQKKSGYQNVCKKCHNKSQRDTRLNNIKLNGYNRRELHKISMKTRTEKKCSVCNITKDINDFYSNNKSLDGHGPKCKSCTNVERKEHYKCNLDIYRKKRRDSHTKYTKQRQNINKLYYINLLGGKCVECGAVPGDK